jgi:hypothetical protein
MQSQVPYILVFKNKLYSRFTKVFKEKHEGIIIKIRVNPSHP